MDQFPVQPYPTASTSQNTPLSLPSWTSSASWCKSTRAVLKLELRSLQRSCLLSCRNSERAHLSEPRGGQRTWLGSQDSPANEPSPLRVSGVEGRKTRNARIRKWCTRRANVLKRNALRWNQECLQRSVPFCRSRRPRQAGTGKTRKRGSKYCKRRSKRAAS